MVQARYEHSKNLICMRILSCCLHIDNFLGRALRLDRRHLRMEDSRSSHRRIQPAQTTGAALIYPNPRFALPTNATFITGINRIYAHKTATTTH
jgi:hypothetical protein